MAEVGGIIFKFQLILESIYAEMKVSVHLLSEQGWAAHGFANISMEKTVFSALALSSRLIYRRVWDILFLRADDAFRLELVKCLFNNIELKRS